MVVVIKSKRRAIVLGISVLTISSCDLFRKEAERTKGQLGGLAKQAGLDEAGESIEKAYKENIAPAVAPVTDMASAAAKNAESVAALNSTITTASEKVDEMQRSAEQYSNQMTRNMPRSERELNRTVDNYQTRFTTWLRSFNPNFGRPISDKKK